MKTAILSLASISAALCQSLTLPGPGLPAASGGGGGGGGGGNTLVANLLGPPGSSGGVTSGAIDINPGGGAANAVYVWASGVISASATTVADSSGNTYVPTVLVNGPTAGSTLWYADNGTGVIGVSSTFTVTVTNCAACAWGVIAAKNMKTTGSYDGPGSNTGTGAPHTSTIQPGSANPGSGNHLIFNILSGGGSTSAWSIDSGFTILQSRANSGGNNYDGAVAYLIQTPNGSAVNPTATFGVASDLTSVIVSFGGV